MNWLDVFIVIFLASSLIRGIEVGFVRQFCSTLGFFVGLFLGVWIESHFINYLDSADQRAVFALLVTLACAITCMLVGEYFGLRLKFKISEGKWSDKLDRVFGSFLAAITLLAAVWLGAAIFRNMPIDSWQRQIRSSRIVALLNHRLPSAPELLTKLGHLIDPNGFPQVFTGLEPTIKKDAPLPNMGVLTDAVQKSRDSVVKIAGEGCGGVVQGTGFVVGDDEVMTNAHVIAGVEQPQILDGNGQHSAQIILFDSELDLAILRATNLAGDALTLNTNDTERGTPAAIVGFPGNEGFHAGPAAVLESFVAVGHDIYNHGKTERSVYSLRGHVEQGNSGGPLIDKKGDVLGVIFAKSTSYDQIGYALTAEQVSDSLETATKRTSTVDSGSCTE